MPSAFGHVLVPLSLRAGLGGERMPWRLAVFAAFSAILPDLDSIGYFLGVPYGSVWGHRGASHSLVFALAWALVSVALAHKLRSGRWTTFFVVGISTSSHTLLDMVTNGGKGVALWWPWKPDRVFLPWRPIRVSPMGADFFSERGLRVVESELCWVGLPSLGLALGLLAWRFVRRRREG
jgi:inner membrane protein